MPNPGTFVGSRGVFLADQKELYAQAVEDGNINDVVVDIQRRYFKRYPISLPHDQEPSQAWLDQVDDDAPEPEIEAPDVTGLSPDEAGRILDDFAALMKNLKSRKDSIRRRLHYIYTKEHGVKPLSKTESDPMTILLARLTGVDFKPPRLKTGYNVWGPQHRELVDPVFDKRIEENDIPSSQHIALRSAIYKELFDKLPQDEQDMWAKKANREHEKAVRELRKKLEDRVSTAPQDRQRAINRTPAFVEPILDLLAELTGWKWSLTGGGPEPADGGRLNMISIHSGVIPGTVRMDFGAAEFSAFKDTIRPAFGSFLKKSYTVSECRSRALPKDHGVPSISQLTEDDKEIDVTRFEIDNEHIEASKSHKPKRLFEGIVGKKSKKGSVAQTGTPSPHARIGPPVGRPKLRPLPSNDKVSASSAPVKSSPLATGPPLTTSSALGKPVSNTVDQSTSKSPSETLIMEKNPSDVDVITVDSSNGPIDTDQTFGPPALNNSLAPTSQTLSPVPSHPGTPQPTHAQETPQPSHPRAPSSSRLGTPPPAHTGTPLPAHTGTPLPAHTGTPSPLHPGMPPPSCSGTPPPSRPGTPPSSHPTTLSLSHHGTSSPTHPGTPQLSHCRLPQSPRLETPPPPASQNPQSHTSSVRYTPVSQTLATPLPHNSKGSQQPTGDEATSLSSTPSGTVTVPQLPPGDASDSMTSTRKSGRQTIASKKAKETVDTVIGKRKALGDGAVMPRKRQRTMDHGAAANLQHAFVLDVPGECVGWASEAVDFLARTDLGPKWRQLVAAWISFEAKWSFVDNGNRLSSAGRPAAVGYWIKCARKPHIVPEVGNVEEFGMVFNKWWSSVQPKWRQVDSGDIDAMQQDSGDWLCLSEHNGPNGLLSVMAALRFWGLSASSNAQKEAWEAAADDVHYVLQQL